MNEVNTIVFSDVHLGSPMSRAYVLLNTLKEFKFKRLIIAGDMFEDIKFQNLTSTHWELLEHIGKISRRGVEVIWLEGNHDVRFFHFMAQLIGIPALKEYDWEVNSRKFLAIHGHQFDNFLVKDNLLGRFLARFYTSIQRIITSPLFDLFYNKIADKWMRVSRVVADEALDYAKKKNCDAVICGHTHIVQKLEKNNIQYFNTGCWNNTPSYLLVIQEDATADFKVVP
ncbi:MAG: hypothetical protein A2297_01050 [Elusimicrobia bacterium RIFOXYB2_FULL_48_7]|nr:MAG: hypothetical protein A2297_01050 [Elusimicrobia bacterium RIFOXYB2_FULL_48_7]